MGGITCEFDDAESAMAVIEVFSSLEVDRTGTVTDAIEHSQACPEQVEALRSL